MNEYVDLYLEQTSKGRIGHATPTDSLTTYCGKAINPANYEVFPFGAAAGPARLCEECQEYVKTYAALHVLAGNPKPHLGVRHYYYCLALAE